ncbi:MAG: type IV secretion system protein [Synergistaceae bacterium]|jgi:type IV secretion system protein TrbL|nr:type IV secretion system protein [Synergistaceae bacterium]
MDRAKSIGVIVLTAFVLCMASPFLVAHAADATGYDSAQGGQSMDKFIGDIQTKVDDLKQNFIDAAKRLFWVLAVIQFAWSAIQLAMSGEFSLFSVARTVIREVMFIGFFWWILTAWPDLGGTIVTQGLRVLGGGAQISPASALIAGVQVIYSLTSDAFTLGVHNAVWAAVPYALALASLAYAAAYAAVYVIEFYLVVPIGVVLIGMGGTLWSYSFAKNYVRVIISVGFKLTILQIVLPIVISMLTALNTTISNVQNVGSQGFFLHSFNLAALSALAFVAVHKLPAMAGALVSGAVFERASWLELAGYGGAASGDTAAWGAGERWRDGGNDGGHVSESQLTAAASEGGSRSSPFMNYGYNASDYDTSFSYPTDMNVPYASASSASSSISSTSEAIKDAVASSGAAAPVGTASAAGAVRDAAASSGAAASVGTASAAGAVRDAAASSGAAASVGAVSAAEALKDAAASPVSAASVGAASSTSAANAVSAAGGVQGVDNARIGQSVSAGTGSLASREQREQRAREEQISETETVGSAASRASNGELAEAPNNREESAPILGDDIRDVMRKAMGTSEQPTQTYETQSASGDLRSVVMSRMITDEGVKMPEAIGMPGAFRAPETHETSTSSAADDAIDMPSPASSGKSRGSAAGGINGSSEGINGSLEGINGAAEGIDGGRESIGGE